MKLIHLFAFLFIYFISHTTIGQVKKIGLPKIKNYNRIQYGGGTQNWAIDQDKCGNIFFANKEGLLQFDGTSWSKFKLNTIDEVKSLKIDPSGTIFVGGFNEFGYFKANSKGKLEYYSLSKQLSKKNLNSLDLIWKIHIVNNEVLFQSFKEIYIYKNNKLKRLKALSQFQFSFLINSKLYIQDIKVGLFEYKNERLYKIKGTNSLNNIEVWGIAPISKNKLVVATLDKGLFVIENNQTKPWNTEANTFVKKNGSLGCISYQKNHIVINTVLNGIIICDLNGTIIQHINSKKGLLNNTALCSFVDNTNNIWIGLDNGISYINENSPLTFFGGSYNLGSVYASIAHQGNLYIATNQGVFYNSWNQNFNENDFKLIEGTTSQAWNIQVFDNILLCASNKGALVIEKGEVIQILDANGYFGFKAIPNQPNHYLGARYNGFTVFEKTENGIKFKNHVKGIDISSGNFEIDHNYIWLKKNKLLYQIKLNKSLNQVISIKSFNKLSNQNQGIGSLQKIKSKIYFQSKNRFFLFSNSENKFIEDIAMSKLFKALPLINIVSEDSQGNLWYTYEKTIGTLINKTHYYKHVRTHFSNLSENLVENYISVNTIDKKNTVIGMTEGLAHYDTTNDKNEVIKPKAYIRTFSLPKDTLIVNNKKNYNEQINIPYSANQVKFTFSSPSYDNLENLEYSYQLEGFDKNWSTWTKSTVKEYTNLKEGNYTIQLKVRNSTGLVSDATAIPFRILPPWYRLTVAYLFYLIFFILFIYYIQIRIKIKIRKNKYLETIEQRRLYLEKETKIKQEQYELEKEIEKLEKEKLQIKILNKDKELVTNSIQVVKKNKTLNGIIQKLKEINTNSIDDATKTQLTKLNKSIVKEMNTDKSWKDLEKHLKNVHYEFLKKLKEKHPKISPREMDLSTFLLMNMSTKEIAEFMNISTAGVELARYRLRKKLELNQKENLISYLMSIK